MSVHWIRYSTQSSRSRWWGEGGKGGVEGDRKQRTVAIRNLLITPLVGRASIQKTFLPGCYGWSPVHLQVLRLVWDTCLFKVESFLHMHVPVKVHIFFILRLMRIKWRWNPCWIDRMMDWKIDGKPNCQKLIRALGWKDNLEEQVGWAAPLW